MTQPPIVQKESSKSMGVEKKEKTRVVIQTKTAPVRAPFSVDIERALERLVIPLGF